MVVVPSQRVTGRPSASTRGAGGVPGEHGVAVFDVVEVAQHRLGGGGAAVGAEVPLQVADPEHQLGDGGGPGVELDAEELVRVDGVAVEAEGGLGLAHLLEEVGDLAFEALHGFEGDVEEVAGAAGGVEDAGRAELAVEGVQGGAGLAARGRRRRGGGRRRGRSPSRRAGARRGWGGRGARRRRGGCSGRRACGARAGRGRVRAGCRRWRARPRASRRWRPR